MVSKPTGLVDHLGRPVKSERLQEEVSAASITGVRQVLSGHPEIGLDPVRLAGILRSAEGGDAVAYLELAEAMEEKYPHYLSVLGTRKRAVAQLPITVEAASDDPEHEADAELVRTWLKRDSLEDELFDILDAIGKAYSCSEVVWEHTAGPKARWWPRRIIRRDPRWFQIDRVDGETLRLKNDTPEGEELEPFKWLVHTHKAKSGTLIRGGLARAVAWTYLFKNYTRKDWVAFAEVYGLPFRLGRYDQGASADDRRALLRALAMIGSDAAGIIPKTTDIEFVDGKMAASDGALFSNLSADLDQEVSKLVLGQTATTDAVATGLGGGLANVHDGVRGDIERADAKLLQATLNQQIAQPMVMLNRGPREAYPRFIIGREDAQDVEATTSALERLVPLGLKVPVSFARKLIRSPEPKPGEEVLTPAATSPAKPSEGAPGGVVEGGGGADVPGTPKEASQGLSKPLKPVAKPDRAPGDARTAVHAAGDVEGGDAIDQFQDEHLGGWREVMTPIIEPIEGLLADATDLEEVRDRLVGTLESMNSADLAELLARGGFSARIAGIAGHTVSGETE